MARIFITGSADGLGSLAAQKLIREGHSVVLHARDDQRAQDARKLAPGAAGCLIADLAHTPQVLSLAEQVNALSEASGPSGKFDAIIHNAGLYKASPEQLFAVNTLAPYLLTALIHKPKRLIYLSSGLYTGGRARVQSPEQLVSGITYSDSKLHIMLLMKAVARGWPALYANAINPGWVPTKMGGRNAPDRLEDGYIPQTWLAVSEESEAKVTGQYFSQGHRTRCLPIVEDTAVQDAFIAHMHTISGTPFR
jgi:NAD(P)-dependent dehydrogenase (short-subunit alcohol dehydrogenase family)